MNTINNIFKNGLKLLYPTSKDRINLYTELLITFPDTFIELLQFHQNEIMEEMYSNDLIDIFVKQMTVMINEDLHKMKFCFESLLSFLIKINYSPIIIPNDYFDILEKNKNLCIQCYKNGFILNNNKVLQILFDFDNIKFIELIISESYKNVMSDILNIINNAKIETIINLFSAMDKNKIKIIINYGKNKLLNKNIILGLLTCNLSNDDILSMSLMNKLDMFAYYDIHLYFNNIKIKTIDLLYSNNLLKTHPYLETLLYFLYKLIHNDISHVKIFNMYDYKRFIMLYCYFHKNCKTDLYKQAYDELLKLIIKYMSTSELLKISNSVLENKFFLCYENNKIDGLYTKYAPLIISITKIYDNLSDNQKPNFCIDNVICGLEESKVEDLEYFDIKIIEDNMQNKELIEYLQIIEDKKKQILIKKFGLRYKNNRYGLTNINKILSGTIKNIYFDYVTTIIKNITGSNNIITSQQILLTENQMLDIMENNENKLQCNICYDKNISKVCKNCGKTSCKECYDILNKKNNSKCPYCNTNLSYVELRI